MYEMCSFVDANISSWGACLQEALFMDSAVIIIFVLGFIAYIAYRMNLPQEVSLILGLGTVFMMAYVWNDSLFLGSLMVITILALVAYLVWGVFKAGKNN